MLSITMKYFLLDPCDCDRPLLIMISMLAARSTDTDSADWLVGTADEYQCTFRSAETLNLTSRPNIRCFSFGSISYFLCLLGLLNADDCLFTIGPHKSFFLNESQINRLLFILVTHNSFSCKNLSEFLNALR